MIVEFWRAYRRQSKSPGSLASRLRGHLARGKYVVGNLPSSLSLRKQMLRTALNIDIDNLKAISSEDVDAMGATHKEQPPGNLSTDEGVEMDGISAAVAASSGNQTSSDYLPMPSIGLPLGDTMVKVTNQREEGRKGSDQAASSESQDHEEAVMGDGGADDGRDDDANPEAPKPSSSIGRVLSAVGNSQRLWNEWHLDDADGDYSGTAKLDPEDDAHFNNDTDDDDDNNDNDEEDQDVELGPRDETAIGKQQFWVFHRGAEGKAEEEEEDEEEEEGATVMRDDAEEDAMDVKGSRHGYSFRRTDGASFREFMGLEQDLDDPRETRAPGINHHHDLLDEDVDGAEEYYIGLETVLRQEEDDEREDDGGWEDNSPAEDRRDKGEDDEIEARIIAHEHSRRGNLTRPNADMAEEEDGFYVGMPGLM